MNDIFITAIDIKKVRNIENFTIRISETERKHLIITGKNGSGKTSLLLEINKFINTSLSSSNSLSEFRNYLDVSKKEITKSSSNEHTENLKKNIKIYETSIDSFGGVEVIFNHGYKDDFQEGLYLLTFFESKRIAKPKVPNGIDKVELKKINKTTEYVNQNFIQYIVNLKAERSFAKDDNDNETANKIDSWFNRFENQLKTLFDAPDLRLIFDRKNYNFHIQIGNHEPFSFTELSDGYSAVLTVVSELILRMEATGNKAYDMQGIALIDEIETHLHVALQKKIMPFLCAFFPNIQFIVTTHSPFILSSISNAVICDLETREVISDLSGYSYDALVESYFYTDKFSEKLKNKFAEFKRLSEKADLTEDEQDLYDEIEEYFDNLPTFRATELEVELQQLKLKKLTSKG